MKNNDGNKIDVIVMASGYSKRYGENKLLLKWDGITLFENSIRQIPFERVNRVVVVTRYKELAEIAKKYPVEIILHDEVDLSDTIKIGMKNLDCHIGTMFMTCDQPLRKISSIERVIDVFEENKSKFVRLGFNGSVGSPVIFPSEYDDELMNLKFGEKGSTILKRNSMNIVVVEADDEYEIIDIDTREMYEALKLVKEME